VKMRVKGNSIRLRLGRSEVEQMVTTGIVEESTIFDSARGHRLEYLLIATPETSVIAATFEEGRVVVRVPTHLALAWGTSDQVGISAVQNSPGGSPLRILVEKDLECIDAPVDESQEDSFPRPDHGVACSSSAQFETGKFRGLSL
jgi:hypothetical protein